MARAVAALFVLIILAVGGVAGLQASLETAGENTTITNETWTPDAGNVTTLEESNRTGAYYSNQTVVYDENETVMDRGDDYRWYPGNGTVEAVPGGGLDGDSDAKITYAYQQTTAEQRQLTAMLGQIPNAIGIFFPVFVFVLFLVFMRG